MLFEGCVVSMGYSSSLMPKIEKIGGRRWQMMTLA